MRPRSVIEERSSWLVPLTLALGALGCANETAVLVIVDAQDTSRARAAVLSLRAFGPDGEEEVTQGRWTLGRDGESELPLVIRVTPRGGDPLRRWGLLAELERADGRTLSESMLVGGFVSGELRRALLCLEDSCLGSVCASGLRCDPGDPMGSDCAGCRDAACEVIEASLDAGAEARCPPVGRPEDDCANRLDDDADGLIDCDDPDCDERRCDAAGGACIDGECGCPGALTEAACVGGVDDDCDGQIDCADADCDGSACGDNGEACMGGECTCPGEARETSCSGGVDEDCDGLVDCADPDCTGISCDDGDACTSGDLCTSAGRCASEPVSCDDGVACTTDTCDPLEGCVSTPSDSACGDENPCTVDRCDPVLGCQNTSSTGACDDGNVCTTGDTCDASGACVGAALSCDDGVACTSDRCDVARGCVNEPSDAACSDSNPCTDDLCHPTLGCQNPANAVGCDDTNPCTTGDVCSGGACRGTLNTCDDRNPCTSNICDPATGACSNPQLADGSACGGSISRCCSGACVRMDSQQHCGGCGHGCAGRACLAASNGLTTGYHCNCADEAGMRGCPLTQTCVRPMGLNYRCSCSNNDGCSIGTCAVQAGGNYNLCRF